MKRAHADFSAADYDGGLARLLKASRACGTIRCSAPTRAALLRDTGVMQLRRGNAGKAAQLFLEARRVDNRVELVAPYDAPDVRPRGARGRQDVGLDTSPQPTGDFSHSPVPEQAGNTPVPIYVEYGGSDSVASVVVKYKAQGRGRLEAREPREGGARLGGVRPLRGREDRRPSLLRAGVRLRRLTERALGRSEAPVPRRHPQNARGPAAEPPRADAASDLRAAGQEEAEITPAETARRKKGQLQCIDDSQCNGGVCTSGQCAEPEHREESRTNFARFWVGVSLSMDVAWLPERKRRLQAHEQRDSAERSGLLLHEPRRRLRLPVASRRPRRTPR